MKQAGTKNPVFLLDEVDKLGVSFQGDPASALLEVLDPAQNDTFMDHYLGVPFDLSEVLFIATANFIQNIPGPLLDRMEVVEFAGYTEREKLEIAQDVPDPPAAQENGLDAGAAQRSPTTRSPRSITRLHPRSGRAAARAGDRQAGRARWRGRSRPARGRAGDGGPRRGARPPRPAQGPPGAGGRGRTRWAWPPGMYYTPDRRRHHVRRGVHDARQGRAGAHRPARRRDEGVGPRGAGPTPRRTRPSSGSRTRCFDRDVHVHVPAGAIPKDGPSAGVTMATALVSALSGRPVRHDIAMTGEITLRGRVLPIGGVKEKVLGAVRAGINHDRPAEGQRGRSRGSAGGGPGQ